MKEPKYILIGEDDPDDQELLKDVFSDIDNSFVLKFVNNGTEVLNSLEKNTAGLLPSLIILDYNMPGLNGADILSEINSNKRYGNIPKIVWSTSGADKFQKICRDRGAIDYVIKPSSISELEKIARYMLSFAICEH